MRLGRNHQRGWTLSIAAAAAIICTSFSPSVSALDLRNILTGYAITSWDVNDGAPEGSVYALAQDRDGYLWLGTDTGLHRFDGSRFRPWSSLNSRPLPGDVVHTLYVSKDGSLWAGFGATGGIARVRGTDVRVFVQADGVPRSAVNTILEDHAGTLWAGTDAGLYFLNGDGWKPFSGGGLPDAAIWGAHVDSGGAMLLATAAGLFRRAGGLGSFQELERFRASPGGAGGTILQGFGSDAQTWTPRLPSDNVVRSIVTDRAGRAFVSDLRSGFRRLGDAAPAGPNHRGRGLQLLFDTRDNLWVATGGQGAWRVGGLSSTGNEPIVERVSAATGLATEGAFSLLEDRDGNIWAGGSPSGLTRLTPQRFIPVSQESSVNALAISSNGHVWVGTSDALIEIARPNRFPLSERRSLIGESIRAVHVDPQGSVWVGTEVGLLRLPVGGRRFERVAGTDNLRQVDSISSDPRGGLLIADVDRGLLQWTERGGLSPVVLPGDLAGTRVVTTYVDSRRRVWLTSVTGRVARLEHTGAVTIFTPEQGFTVGPTRIIHEDERGVIWFGGTNGVTRYEREQAVTILGDERLPIRLIRGITDDRDGYLWIATTSGLLRIHHAEAEKAAADSSYRPTYAFYDKSDGLAGLPRMRSDHTAVRTADGSLWFVTGEGITIVPPDPRNEDVNAPRVGVDGVTVDDRSVAAAPGAEFAAGIHRLQIEYAALNLTSAHKMRFRFRLEGVDSDWVEAGPRRQASYTNLRSGGYRFRVAATDALGGWREPAQAWVFSIRPHFYETRWFVSTCGGIVLLTIWGAWTLRLRQERKRFSLVLSERARLSREIHDTLLQGLVGLVLQCDAIAQDIQSAAPTTTDQLIRLRRQAQRYIKEARHAIWKLRSSSAASTDLSEALRDFGKHAAGTSVGFSVTTQGVPRSLGEDVDRELLRIAQEAVTNAGLHSHARQIDVVIVYSASGVMLTVSDDGCGFTDAHLDGLDGHYGLLSMRERAEVIGADLRLDSRAGRGTRIELTVPQPSRPTRKIAV